MSCTVLCAFLIQPYAQVTIENRHFRYEVESNGQNRCFTDKATGEEHLFLDTVSHCAYIIREGKRYNANRVSQEGENVRIRFGESGVTASLRLYKLDDHVNIKLVEVTGKPESIVFLNIPLNLKPLPDEPFAACALAMNLQTHVEQLPALQDHLWAAAYERFGTIGSEVNLVGVPRQEILPVIRNIMQQAKEIPFSDQGGAWASLGKEGYGSYLMNFGALTEETVNEWIKMCKSLGFNQIDNHGGGNFFTFGDFTLNKEKWPDGWDSFKRINQKLHKAGISSIFHTYAFCIEKNSIYVTPVPSPDLGYIDSFTLLNDIGASDDEITVAESTANVSLLKGFSSRNSTALRIGEELIEFKGVSTTPPYKFTGCQRGAYGTKASSHKANEKGYRLKEVFSQFVPGEGTPLFHEIAKKTADIVNYCDFDGVYFDAIDASDIFEGQEYAWYHGGQFVAEVFKHLKRPVGMEMSTMFHHWWHYRSRWQAWDKPRRGYKRFVDVHLASIKEGEREHGIWSGGAKEIDTFAPLDGGKFKLPLHLGWWGLETGDLLQVESTFPDDIEYLCCKMIGNNAGLSMLGGVDEKTLNDKPLFKRLVPIIRQYEELRLKGYFNDSICALLRQPEKEYTLFKEKRGKWNFKPINYQKHKVVGTTDESSTWVVNNEFASQRPRLRIELLMSVKSYTDTENIVLADFSRRNEFTDNDFAEGVVATMASCKEKTPGAEATAAFSAFSLGVAPREGTWAKAEKRFTSLLNLKNNQALGVWIKGDGKGELLNVRIESPQHVSGGARGDHFIKVDFTGWKYFELVEIESSESSNYLWPKPKSKLDFYVYDSYRHTVDFNKIDKLQLWYNNIPKGTEVNCVIGPIKALPLVTNTIKNPTITLGNDTITFPVTMESGMYLELDEKGQYIVYGSKGEEIKKGRLKGLTPVLRVGENKMTFSCDETGNVRGRARVTIATVGEALVKR